MWRPLSKLLQERRPKLYPTIVTSDGFCVGKEPDATSSYLTKYETSSVPIYFINEIQVIKKGYYGYTDILREHQLKLRFVSKCKMSE
jgi:hypothetical protein